MIYYTFGKIQYQPPKQEMQRVKIPALGSQSWVKRSRSITGHFDDGLSLSFIPEPGADPDNFDAQNYVSAATGGALIYNDANGWSVKYDPSVISVNGGGPVTTFVYTGESAETMKWIWQFLMHLQQSLIHSSLQITDLIVMYSYSMYYRRNELL